MKSHWSLRRLYLHFNRKWFNGELPLDTQLTWEACNGDVWAECRPMEDGSFHLVFDPILRGIHCYSLQLLIHEMCHIKVFLDTNRWGRNHDRLHGKHSRWQIMMRDLAARGAFDDLW